MKWTVKVFESGTAMPHTAEFEIEADDSARAMQEAQRVGAAMGYDVDDIATPELDLKGAAVSYLESDGKMDICDFFSGSADLATVEKIEAMIESARDLADDREDDQDVINALLKM
jgi:hypothetical protein